MRGSKRRPSRSRSWSPRTSPQRLLQLNIPSSGVHALRSGCTTPNARSLSLLNRCNRPPRTPPLVSLYPLILVSLYANDRIFQTKNGRMTGRLELKHLLHHHLLLSDRRAASLPRGVGRVMSKGLFHLRKIMWMLCMSSQSGGREVERASVRLLGNLIICQTSLFSSSVFASPSCFGYFNSIPSAFTRLLDLQFSRSLTVLYISSLALKPKIPDLSPTTVSTRPVVSP